MCAIQKPSMNVEFELDTTSFISQPSLPSGCAPGVCTHVFFP